MPAEVKPACTGQIISVQTIRSSAELHGSLSKANGGNTIRHAVFQTRLREEKESGDRTTLYSVKRDHPVSPKPESGNLMCKVTERQSPKKPINTEMPTNMFIWLQLEKNWGHKLFSFGPQLATQITS